MVISIMIIEVTVHSGPNPGVVNPRVESSCKIHLGTSVENVPVLISEDQGPYATYGNCPLQVFSPKHSRILRIRTLPPAVLPDCLIP